jgi:hypothetical protein
VHALVELERVHGAAAGWEDAYAEGLAERFAVTR